MNNFSILEYPIAAPGQCMLCGASDNREWWLDLDRSEEFYGAQYICSSCVGSIVDVCGFASPAKVTIMQTELDAARDISYELRIENDGLKDIKRGLSKLGVTFLGDSGNPTVDDDSLLVLEVDGTAESDLPGGKAGLGNGEGTSDESGDDSDVGVLHTDGPDSKSPAV